MDTIMTYRITYTPQDIIRLLESKEEDPFDIEGIVNPVMKRVKYRDLKSYLIQKIEVDLRS